MSHTTSNLQSLADDRIKLFLYQEKQALSQKHPPDSFIPFSEGLQISMDIIKNTSSKIQAVQQKNKDIQKGIIRFGVGGPVIIFIVTLILMLLEEKGILFYTSQSIKLKTVSLAVFLGPLFALIQYLRNLLWQKNAALDIDCAILNSIIKYFKKGKIGLLDKCMTKSVLNSWNILRRGSVQAAEERLEIYNNILIENPGLAVIFISSLVLFEESNSVNNKNTLKEGVKKLFSIIESIYGKSGKASFSSCKSSAIKVSKQKKLFCYFTVAALNLLQQKKSSKNSILESVLSSNVSFGNKDRIAHKSHEFKKQMLVFITKCQKGRKNQISLPCHLILEWYKTMQLYLNISNRNNYSHWSFAS